jgi:ribosomal-protein-alanine N-acetyltransferase
MHYRLFKVADFDALYAIEEICFQPPLRFSRRYMRSIIGDPNGVAWVAEDAGRIAGFAVAGWTCEQAAAVAYLQTIEVDPQQRGKGVASELLKRIETSAHSAGALTLWLHVDATNAVAIRLYERHGFKFYGREDHYYAPDRGALVYTKSLSEITVEPLR